MLEGSGRAATAARLAGGAAKMVGDLNSVKRKKAQAADLSPLGWLAGLLLPVLEGDSSCCRCWGGDAIVGGWRPSVAFVGGLTNDA